MPMPIPLPTTPQRDSVSMPTVPLLFMIAFTGPLIVIEIILKIGLKFNAMP
jgi:hypothetical protein